MWTIILTYLLSSCLVSTYYLPQPPQEFPTCSPYYQGGFVYNQIDCLYFGFENGYSCIKYGSVKCNQYNPYINSEPAANTPVSPKSSIHELTDDIDFSRYLPHDSVKVETTDTSKKALLLSNEDQEVNDIGNSLKSPLQALKGITVTGTILAVILLATGFIFTFFGQRLFKPVLFIAGFYVFAVLSFVALSAIETRQGTLLFGDNRAIVFLIIAIVSGFIGGALFVCVWRLGLSAIGALLGFALAMIILSLVTGGAISNGTGRTIFIIVLCVLGAILIQFIEKPILIIGTAIPGSYAIFFGVDIFTNTGFNVATQMFLTGHGFYTTSGAVYGMLAGVAVVALLGIVVQWNSNKKRKGYVKA